MPYRAVPPPPGTVTSEPPLDTLRLPSDALPLPSPEDVTDGQSRGASCVWCGHGPLSTDAVVDLGTRKNPLGGSWFPRACPHCVTARAHRALSAHASMCEQCVDEAARCETGSALQQLVRESRR
ncbi:hypothetical protein [Streptomyces sp. SAT1]|uniref:hypothetical protein n=1 Tax=Streptomyces sp. SAT1 TaxID=1849967 RepID=UPI001F2774E5|nr:hypothetical protein [Streptomyces sp. SAT1]